MSIENLSGLIAATFTPMDDRGALNLDMIPMIVDQLISEGVSGLYVCGGTGEGGSLTSDERKQTAEAYLRAATPGGSRPDSPCEVARRPSPTLTRAQLLWLIG